MSVFSEKTPGSGGGGAREGVPGLSIIGAGMRVVGDIAADGVVKIEGSVSGTVRAAKQVLVARGGEVEGDVVSREAINGGLRMGEDAGQPPHASQREGSASLARA